MSNSTRTAQTSVNTFVQSIHGIIQRLFRRLGLFGGPLLALIPMWFHPHAGEDVYGNLSPGIDTFLAVHAMQFTAYAGLAVALCFLLVGFRSPTATLGRVATVVYAFFTLAFVGIVGLAKGVMIKKAQSLPAEQQAGVAEVVGSIQTDPYLFAVGVVGAIGYLVAVLAIGVVYRRRGAPLPATVLLVASVVAIGAHSGIVAVAGMTSFAIGVAWLEFGWEPEASQSAEAAVDAQ